MNKQNPPKGIEWTRIRIDTAYDVRHLPGYTWNPISGCMHDCEWVMPDGTVAQCYAKTVAERVAQKAYPHGFDHHYWHPERLDEPLRIKTGAGIFLDSMSDLMGHWVPEEQIRQVLDVCRRASWHTFLLLTKNPRRLLDFEFPENVWVGASSPPDSFWGNRLGETQQRRMLETALKSLAKVEARIKWMSFEPYPRDYSDIIAAHPGALQWAVIGAASRGRELFDVNTSDLRKLLAVLDKRRVPVFYKGNMKINKFACYDWREEFPTSYHRRGGTRDAAERAYFASTMDEEVS